MSQKVSQGFYLQPTLFEGLIIPQKSTVRKVAEGVMIEPQGDLGTGVKIIGLPCQRGMRYRLRFVYACTKPWELLGFRNGQCFFALDLFQSGFSGSSGSSGSSKSSKSSIHDFYLDDKEEDSKGRFELRLRLKCEVKSCEDGKEGDSNLFIDQSSTLECLGWCHNTVQVNPFSLISSSPQLILSEDSYSNHEKAAMRLSYGWYHFHEFSWINVREWRTTELGPWTWIIVFAKGVPWLRSGMAQQMQAQIQTTPKTKMVCLSQHMFVIHGSALQALLLRPKILVSDWRADCQKIFDGLPSDEKFALNIVDFRPQVSLLSSKLEERCPPTRCFVTLLFLTDPSQLVQLSLLLQKALSLYIINEKFHYQRHQGAMVFLNSTDVEKAHFITQEAEKYRLPIRVFFTPESKTTVIQRKAALILLSKIDPQMSVHIIVNSHINVDDTTWLSFATWVKQTKGDFEKIRDGKTTVFAPPRQG